MERLRHELESIRNKGLYRRLRRMESAASTRVIVDGREMLMCASNNYLGLADDHRLIEAAIEAIRKYGTGSSGSRLTTGNTALHEQLEERIARFKGTEAAIVFNTGYMANVAAMTALATAGDVIFSDEWNHASLIDGCRLSKADVVIYRHADLKDLEEKLMRYRSGKRNLIVTDGVFSMDGDIANLPGIVELAERYGAWVMVDDAHATGVLGRRGAGTVEHFDLHGRVHIQMGTLSKAVGAEGGYIAGTHELIEYLRNCARPFIFSTALSPGVIGTALTAIDLIENEPERRARLSLISKRVREELIEMGFRVMSGETPILPILIGEAERAVEFSHHLEEQGVFAPAIRPPSVPQGTSRIRLTLMATHTDEDVRDILGAFARIGQKMGVIR
ncbi:8-amino-7-oxononanoate synthase [Collibacillus ludicampi]|uniref:8-amino-7-ketopelargonate synthase n=1 Tax=Collibacillus ludicampi TaxID=2771369 RepID=A0AAV4LGG1_9BACL|nr:8-amino-7-oxononanoate synthase [Collibacillus ludicampi]GIM46875.1 8-amino-7-oxononanoate synthase [Collibacillus ludicampi]